MFFVILFVIGVLLLALESYLISEFGGIFLIIMLIVMTTVTAIMFKNSIKKFKNFYMKNLKKRKVIMIILTIIGIPIFILGYALFLFISLFIGPLMLPFLIVFRIGKPSDYNISNTPAIEQEKEINEFRENGKENKESREHIQEPALFDKRLKYCHAYTYGEQFKNPTKPIEMFPIAIARIGGLSYRTYDPDTKVRRINREPENKEILNEINELEREIEKYIGFKVQWKEETREQKSNKTSSNTSAYTTTNKSNSETENLAREYCEYLGLKTSGILSDVPEMVRALESVNNIPTNRKLANTLKYETFGSLKCVYVPDRWQVRITGGSFWTGKEDIIYYDDSFFTPNDKECRKRMIATCDDVRIGKVIIFHKGKMVKYRDIL